MAKKKETKIEIPADKQDRFNELMDKYMDKQNLSGDAAYKRAMDELGLSPRKLHEGMKRAMRLIKAGLIEPAEKEAMRQAFRRGSQQYDLDSNAEHMEAGEMGLSNQTKSRKRAAAGAHKLNIQKLGLELYPNIPGERYEFQRKSSAKDRREFKTLAKEVTDKTTASKRADELYNEMPVVAKGKNRQAEIQRRLKELKSLMKMKNKGLI